MASSSRSGDAHGFRSALHQVHPAFARAVRARPPGSCRPAPGAARAPSSSAGSLPPVHRDRHGSRITDVDGNEYVDYLLGLGPMILGHRHPVVTTAVKTGRGARHVFRPALRARDRGGREGRRRGARVEKVRFTNSGSEAVGTAVRLARAFTGRRLWFGSRATITAGRTRSTGATTSTPPRPGRPTPAPGGVGPRRAAGARRHARRAHLERPRGFQPADGRARRRDRRGDHRARGVQHRLHPARARLSRAAAGRDAPARRPADLRRGHHRFSVLPRRWPGVVGVTPDSPRWPRAWAAAFRWPRWAARARSWA